MLEKYVLRQEMRKSKHDWFDEIRLIKSYIAIYGNDLWLRNFEDDNAHIWERQARRIAE